MAEVASTPAERLAQVQEAIVKVLYGGQSYQIGSRKLTRADLSLLREMEKELRAAGEDANAVLLVNYFKAINLGHSRLGG